MRRTTLLFFIAASSLAIADGAGPCRGLTHNECLKLVEETHAKKDGNAFDADVVYHSACRNGVAAGCIFFGKSEAAQYSEIRLSTPDQVKLVNLECAEGTRVSCEAAAVAGRVPASQGVPAGRSVEE